MESTISAENMRTIRGRKRITLEKLARLADISLTTVVTVEAGRVEPRIHTARRIAAALGVPLDAIVFPAECRGQKRAGAPN